MLLSQTSTGPLLGGLSSTCLVCRAFTAIVLLIVTGPAGRLHAAAPDASVEYDIVVYGGTSGGVVAAVQARRMGKSVLLIEPSKHLGGLTSGGLGATDIGNKGAIGGLARDFYRRVKQHYAADENWKCEKRAEFKGRGHTPQEDTAWTFEPHVAEQLFGDLVREHQIPVAMAKRLAERGGVRKTGTRLTALVLESGEVYRGKMFIDATYEGDLLAQAGVAFHVGRESNATYGETLNGIQVKNSIHHQFVRPVDPYIRRGDASSGVLPGINPKPPAADGTGDDRVQAYNYRLCATDQPANRLPWPKPAGYQESQYELLLRNFEAGDLRLPWNPVLMPNRKTDSNNNFAVSTDNIGMNYAYPTADYATRERIIKQHVAYQQGLMWTLANHPRVPEQVRAHFQTWGLSRDEFVDNDHWPHQLYVREARRMISDYVMAEQNCRGQQKADDPVGLAAYTMDSHNIQRYVTTEGTVRNEGDVQVGGFPPYSISYRSIVPKAAECANLLVPVCLSASHIAYGSIRMEPVFMVLGQSAATAAVMAIDGAVTVQDVDYPKLRTRLLADAQVLDWTAPVRPAGAGSLDARRLAGIVVDDSSAERHGFEALSTAIGPYVGDGYRHDENERPGEQWARFRPDILTAGKYEVQVAYTAGPNRATRVPIKVVHADGTATATINQQQAPKIDRVFVSLGTFSFEKGTKGYVEIRNDDADGHVIIDAVRWVSPVAAPAQ